MKISSNRESAAPVRDTSVLIAGLRQLGPAGPRAIFGAVRHNPSTVVVLAGRPGEQALAAVGRSLNVVLVRPAEQPPGPGAGPAPPAEPEGAGGIGAAAAALRRAAGITAPYVLVAADPLSAAAEAWRDMWSVTAGPRGSDEFELRAAQALAAWRSGQFELPDYYLVVAGQSGPGESGPGAAAARAADFYLGPLRSVRPNRVAVAAADEPAAQAAAVLGELGALGTAPGGRPSRRSSGPPAGSTRAPWPSRPRPGAAPAGSLRPAARGGQTGATRPAIDSSGDLHGRRACRRTAGHAANRRSDADQARRRRDAQQRLPAGRRDRRRGC